MNTKEHKALELRLHRIEGQVRGIARMLNENRPTNETLIQLRAIDAALAAVMGILTREYAMSEVTAALDMKNTERRLALDAIVSDVLRLRRP